MADTTQLADFVIAANRLPVDRDPNPEGDNRWRTSPGGLVSAMLPVMHIRQGAWVGWAGEPDVETEPFRTDDGLEVHPVQLHTHEIRDYYEGFSNGTLWPIYHDVITEPEFHRRWWASYRDVNERFARTIAAIAAPGATVWVHDYQLQLVPALLRELRPDVRIGWFCHIPFPPVELFAQLPWRAPLLRGLLGADFVGFQLPSDARNFIRACRSLLGATSKGDVVTWPGSDDGELGGIQRITRASAVPISVDFGGLESLAMTVQAQERASAMRASLGNPKAVMLGVDRLDYTKGLRHRLRAISELLADGAIDPAEVAIVQVATPSRERVAAYQRLRSQVERMVGRINGEFANMGQTPVHYLHQSYPRDEMAAMFQAADVMLVTPLRDGMNLVAKEYVTCRHDLGGALVLSEFAGAAAELNAAYTCNPHDIVGMKRAILTALHEDPGARRRRMRTMRRRVRSNDVHTWAKMYLEALEFAPAKPPRE
ncbi:MAG: trehalose-6-phosphate synthase [Ornithinimicrobium sp.]